ncbi:MAG: MCE family protein [Granulosicoccus sp.]|nr:MCE family protein [Granulosicoccus sp.]
MSIDKGGAPSHSRVHRGRSIASRLSLAWVLPLAAALFAGWVIWESYAKRGPLVQIQFDNAGGVNAGETRVRRNDVDVGRVESVRLSDDLDSVVVSVRLDPQVASYLDEDTRFWIVNARINTTEISGLGTLLSGAYIEVDWDDVPGERRSAFVGLDEPPLTKRGTPGLRLTLNADEAGYIYVGSPVFYRQIEVGRVERRRLSTDASQVLFDIFIEAPYHTNVYPETRFFGVSGVEANVGADGATVRVESIAALFTGGIAFENSIDNAEAQPVGSNGKAYKLFGSRKEARDSIFDGTDDQRFRFMAKFPGSVKGLRRDAIVEYNGLKVGEVTSVSVKLPNDPKDAASSTVVMQFQPSRLGFDEITQREWFEKIESLVVNGMRVQLSTSNILTGTLLVKLITRPELATENIDFSALPYPELPVIASNVEAVTADVETLVKNLSELPLDTLVDSATRLLENTNSLLASPELAVLPQQLSTSMQSIALAAERIEAATDDLPSMLQSLTTTADSANDVLEGLSPDSEIYIELSAAARELRVAAQSIAAFAEFLEENPNAVLTGR